MERRSIIFYFIFLFGCSQYISAQKDTEKAIKLKYKLFDSICNCINKADTNSITNIGDAQIIISNCIGKNMGLLGDYAEATGINWEKITREKLQELTTYVLTEINGNCQAMKAILNRTKTQFNNTKTDTIKIAKLKNRLTDSICVCISKTDTSSVNTLDDAQQMLSRCITNQNDLLVEYAESKGIDWSKISAELLQEIANGIATDEYEKCAAMKIMIKRVQTKRN